MAPGAADSAIELGSLAQALGPSLLLRLVQPEDAGFVHALRNNPAANRYLSPSRGTVEDQRRWIEDYKWREAQKTELYYVIERLDGAPCGTVRLYNIKSTKFTWGSWILGANKTKKAALESALLSFGLGFEGLRLEVAMVSVRRENSRAEAFYRRLGMTEVGGTKDDISFVYLRTRFLADRQALWSVIQQEATR